MPEVWLHLRQQGLVVRAGNCKPRLCSLAEGPGVSRFSVLPQFPALSSTCLRNYLGEGGSAHLCKVLRDPRMKGAIEMGNVTFRTQPSVRKHRSCVGCIIVIGRRVVFVNHSLCSKQRFISTRLTWSGAVSERGPLCCRYAIHSLFSVPIRRQVSAYGSPACSQPAIEEGLIIWDAPSPWRTSGLCGPFPIAGALEVFPHAAGAAAGLPSAAAQLSRESTGRGRELCRALESRWAAAVGSEQKGP